MRRSLLLASAFALVLAVPVAYACEKPHLHRRAQTAPGWQKALFGFIDLTPVRDQAAAQAARRPPESEVDLSAYKGLAAWFDIYNEGWYEHPLRAVKRLHRRGAKAIFLQTSTYGQRRAILHQPAIARILRAAHRRGMKVIAWYVPSFRYMEKDRQRVMHAINHRTRFGDSFDSFALDIEATVVDRIDVRNKRLINLGEQIRKRTGWDYPLGAITPDPLASLYWPNFPFKTVARQYDVFVPMGYFTFRAKGYRQVRDYTRRNIELIREATGRSDVPIHYIGGIADDVEPKEARAMVRVARREKLLGGSLYDSPITGRKAWKALEPLNGGPVATRAPQARTAKGPKR